MLLNNFSLSSTKIKSNWLNKKGDYGSVFHKIDKEEGLNLYFQLFRFRQHQMNGNGESNYKHHIFRVTIGELREYTKINTSKRLSYYQTFELLKKLSIAGMVKLHAPARWDVLVDKNKNVDIHRLIVLEGLDYPNLTVNEKGDEVPVDPNEDYYIPINFKTLYYMYEVLGLNAKDVSVYYLLMKLSNGGEKKAFISMNGMKDWLGYGIETIKESLIKLNQNYLVATYVKREKNQVRYNHLPVKKYDDLLVFKDEHGDAFRKFLKRYGIKLEKENVNTFDDEWGDTSEEPSVEDVIY